MEEIGVHWKFVNCLFFYELPIIRCLLCSQAVWLLYRYTDTILVGTHSIYLAIDKLRVFSQYLSVEGTKSHHCLRVY